MHICHKGLLIIIYLVCLCCSEPFQWQLINPNLTTETIYDMVISNSQSAVAVGAKGTIIKTTREANTWYTVASPTVKNLYSICQSSDNTLFAVGDQNTILRSGDKGEHWEVIYCADSLKTSKLQRVIFPTSKTGYIIGTRGLILKSNNYGMSWEVISPTDFSALNALAITPNKTIVGASDLGELIFSFNVGKSWKVYEKRFSAYFNDISCNHDRWVIVGAPGKVIHSYDEGKTWGEESLQGKYWLWSIAMVDNSTGVTVGDSGVIYRTTDGCKHWELIDSKTRTRLNRIRFYDSVGCIVGGGGSAPNTKGIILHSENAGASWSIVLDNFPRIIRDIVYVSKNLAFAVGDSSTALRSEDGGKTWSSSATQQINNYTQIMFCDSLNGLINSN